MNIQENVVTLYMNDDHISPGQPEKYYLLDYIFNEIDDQYPEHSHNYNYFYVRRKSTVRKINYTLPIRKRLNL